MKKHYLPLALALALGLNLSAQSRFDASSQIYADHYMNFVREPGAELADFPNLPFKLDAESRSAVTAEIMAILSEGTTAEDLEAFGLEVRGIVGGVAICTGSMDDIIALAETDLTTVISFSQEMKCMLNNAREDDATGVDDIHAGEGFEMPYKGKGVVVGIFDVGMDPNHVNFKTADLSESRIKSLWMYNDNGRESAYTTPEAIARFTTDDRSATHGTHTMGCLAGSYTGNGDFYTVPKLSLSGTATLNRNKPIPYYGMAPEAEIVASCGPSLNSNIVLACQKMASYIKASGKPGLISLSFGSQMGPHDITSPGVKALNEIAKDVPFFIAAGNEGANNNSLIGTISDSEKSFKTFLKVINSLNGNCEVDIWSGDNRPLKVSLVIFDRTSKTELYRYTLPNDGSATLSTSGYGASAYIKDDAIDKAYSKATIGVSQSLNRSNNRYNVSIKPQIYSLATGNGGQRYIMGIEVSGENGQHFDLINGRRDNFDPQIELTGWDVSGWLDGGNGMSLNDLACGDEMICVGSWNTRRNWANLDGYILRFPTNDYDPKKISPFSSYGTLADGRTLPMVCAPGSSIISSISGYHYTAMGMGNSDVAASTKVDGKTHYYQAQQGTSMATPIAAGICALWLQAEPQLNPYDVRYIIEHTSTDPNDPNNAIRWGAGKINAIEGLKMAVKIYNGVADVTVNPADIVITADGNNWQVVAPGAAGINTVVYDLNGRPVIKSDVKGDTAEICGENLQPGIYILTVNGTLSRRVAVK